MTQETMNLCEAEMNEAIESGDQKRIWRANARFNKAMMDCQFKTANRVKWLVKSVYALMAAVAILAVGGEDVLLKIAHIAVK